MAMTNFDVEFTKDGAIFDQTQVDALLAGLAPVTDLLVLSHGWNNDKADASQLYDELLGNLDKLLDLRNQPRYQRPRGLHQSLRGREFAAVRIYWPSKKFTDEELIPGGGAASAQAEQENIAAVEKRARRPQGGPGAARRSPTGPGSRQGDGASAKALLPQLATVDAPRRSSSSCCAQLLDPDDGRGR